jgi:hypothetical protein
MFIQFFLFHFSLVVVGGGSGGCGTANKFAAKVGRGKVINFALLNYHDDVSYRYE